MPIRPYLLVLMAAAGASAASIADEHPLSAQDRAKLTAESQAVLSKWPSPAAADTNATQVHSRRGDARFFLGQFTEAVSEYRAMIAREPKLDDSHWRLGIALFFAGQPKAAAEQFDKYHSWDDVDRENGIWRYLSHYRAFGAERASAELLRYEKDDREPFPAVYKLFEGKLTSSEAITAVSEKLSAVERDKRLFYTELYIGMQMVVREEYQTARKYLRQATARQWPRNAGFGPNYMWHVGRVQLELLLAEPRQSHADDAATPGNSAPATCR